MPPGKHVPTENRGYDDDKSNDDQQFADRLLEMVTRASTAATHFALGCLPEGRVCERVGYPY